MIKRNPEETSQKLQKLQNRRPPPFSTEAFVYFLRKASLPTINLSHWLLYQKQLEAITRNTHKTSALPIQKSAPKRTFLELWEGLPSLSSQLQPGRYKTCQRGRLHANQVVVVFPQSQDDQLLLPPGAPVHGSLSLSSPHPRIFYCTHVRAFLQTRGRKSSAAQHIVALVPKRSRSLSLGEQQTFPCFAVRPNWVVAAELVLLQLNCACSNPFFPP